MNYHYRCRGCDKTTILSLPADEADTDPTKQHLDSGQAVHPECGGTIKREWGFRLSTYRNVDHKTGKEFWSEREYARHLRTKSQIVTDRTGIVHDFVPVDLDDPMVRPDSDAGLKEQHDGQVARGEKESRGTFVFDAVPKPPKPPKPSSPPKVG